MEQAVEVKIEEQAEFVKWWEEVVQGPGGDRQSVNHSRGSALMVPDAEELSGITQQQVSKWRTRLEDKDAYRERLYGVAWRQAMGLARTVDVTEIRRRTIAMPEGKYQSIVCDD